MMVILPYKTLTYRMQSEKNEIINRIISIKIASKFLLITCMICFSGMGFAQYDVADYFSEMKNHDLSVVITTEFFGEGEYAIERPPILGFIGDDYQRFFIHFISVTQNQANPYEYRVSGKTKVRDNICSFEGTIKIVEAKLFTEPEFPEYKQGYAVCEVSLFENREESGSGFFEGNLESRFTIDEHGTFAYDDLMQMGDGFYNNQFVGTWTSYRTNSSKKCHWGDFRIPQSGDLDQGIGEFIVNEKYAKNGWSNYITAYAYHIQDEIQKAEARAIEKEKWWNGDLINVPPAYLISDKSVGEFKIGQQILLSYSSDMYTIEKDIRKERIEGENLEIVEYSVFENGDLALVIELRYDWEAEKHTDIIDEIRVVSEKYKTKEGIGVNSTIDDFIRRYPKYNLWYGYIREWYVIDCERMDTVLFFLNEDDYISELEIVSEITPLKFADFKKNAKIKNIRMY